ncbi:MAG: hypothetical protein IKY67_06650 [Paludibacteraceae bacterium]|nr:hypothetical protein [Paludibacteraceae bacterium]
MASSGSFQSILSSTGKISFSLGWYIEEQSIINNTSTIGIWTAMSPKENFLNLSCDWSITIGPQTQSGSKYFGQVNAGSYYAPFMSDAGTFVYVTVPHNPDGTKSMTISFTINFGSYMGTVSYSDTVELDPIARDAKLLTAPDFNDEQNPTITYSNAAGSVATLAAAISLDGTTATVPYRTISSTGTSYTFSLTTAERNALRKGVTTGNHKGVTFLLRTTISSYQGISSLNKNFTLINYEPVINPTITDSNALVNRLTGSNKKFILDFSNAAFNTGAAAQKQATLVEQYVICGTTQIDNSSTGTINEIDSNTFYFSATDSRGYTTRKAEVIDTLDYVKLTCNLKSSSLSGDGVLTFTIGGNYFNGSFGAVQNSLEFEYGLRQDDGDITWKIISGVNPTFSGDTYSLTYSIPGLTHESSYTLTLNAIDELMSIQSVPKKVGSISVFDWGKNDFKHNTDVYLEQGKSLRTNNTEGSNINVLNLCNDDNRLVLGWGNYEQGIGGTNIYGEEIVLNSNNTIKSNNNLRFNNTKIISGLNKSGVEMEAIEPCDANNNINIGFGGYSADLGSTNIYGRTINMTSKGSVYINGRAYGANKVLYSSTGNQMGASATITLSEAISKQPSGIILVFSLYNIDTSTAQNASWNSHYVPKEMLTYDADGGYTFFMGINAGFSVIGAKYLMFSDTTITGHSGNTLNGTNSGITFDNRRFVLRYVFGV